VKRPEGFNKKDLCCKPHDSALVAMSMYHGETCQVWIGRVPAGAPGGDFKDLTGFRESLALRVLCPRMGCVGHESRQNLSGLDWSSPCGRIWRRL